MWGHTGHTEFLHRKPVTTHVKRLPGRFMGAGHVCTSAWHVLEFQQPRKQVLSINHTICTNI